MRCLLRLGRLALVVPGVLFALAIGVGESTAQTDGGRFEVAAGARWIGTTKHPSVFADQQTLSGGSRPLFVSRSQLDGSVGPAAVFGVRLSGALTAEAAFAYNPSQFVTRISDDAEGVADTSIGVPLRQFLIEGGVRVAPRGWRRGALAPFASGGAGYLRQLYDGRTLIANGHLYYLGGGLYYERASGRPSRVKGTGLRADLRAVMLRDGVAPDSGGHVAPSIVLSAFARF